MSEAKPGTKPPTLSAEDRSRRRFRVLLAGRIVVFLSLTAAFLWYGETRLRKMELRLRMAEDKARAVSQLVLEFSQELDLLRQRTDRAQKEASEAQQSAKASAAAQRQSEQEAQRARDETEQARAEAQQAQGELDRLRQARQRELDRMQEALNQVAPTRRTSSGMVIELANESFQFAFNSATLRPENREILSRIAGVLLASKGYSLYVYGHTDEIGADEYNLDLSERRAASVRDYLVKAGIPAALIRTKGFGKSSPLGSEKTRAAREKNRRVEIGIVDTIIRYETEVKGSQPSAKRSP